MIDFKKAKEIYNRIDIPEELEDRTNQAIQNARPYKKQHIFRNISVSLAACAALFMVMLNSSQVFAENMGQVPILSGLVRILTIRSYETGDADKNVKVNIPAVDSGQQVAVNANEEILKIVDQHVKEAEQRVDEYKDAFLETGGTQEEFTEKDIRINVNYSIKSETPEVVSFVVTSSENWANAYTEQYFYNLDLINNKRISLQDILGKDYVSIANESILRQMKERAQNQGNYYFNEEEGGFTTITDETNFYINESGNPVIVFERYGIAPGHMGIQEFEIKK